MPIVISPEQALDALGDQFDEIDDRDWELFPDDEDSSDIRIGIYDGI